MTDPTADRPHVVTRWREREGRRWFFAACTCGAQASSDDGPRRDAAMEGHRVAGLAHAAAERAVGGRTGAPASRGAGQDVQDGSAPRGAA